MRKLTHEEIVERQIEEMASSRVPLVVVLDNIRSLHNVGSIFRAADGIGIEKIYLCGITGYPPQSGILKTSLGAEESVVWEYQKSAKSVVNDLKLSGYEIIALEQAEDAISYANFKANKPICLILGNEVEGVSNDLMALSDWAFEIEMKGVKNSLNVGMAFGVVGFALRESLRNLA